MYELTKLQFTYRYMLSLNTLGYTYKLSIQTVVQKQYQRIINDAANRFRPQIPLEGWLRTVRKALGISGAQLARKMGVTRARVAQAEHAELSGGATLKSMQTAADAMGCRFVYAIVPEKRIEDIIAAQARRKALALVRTTSTHMALESQNLPDDKIAAEVDRIANELLREMPPDFWNDK